MISAATALITHNNQKTVVAIDNLVSCGAGCGDRRAMFICLAIGATRAFYHNP
jgi:hypothetical protein